MLVTKHLTVAIDFHFVGKKYTMEVNGFRQLLPAIFRIYIFSMEESNSYRFGTSRKWVNYDRIFIFRWTITLNVVQYLS